MKTSTTWTAFAGLALVLGGLAQAATAAAPKKFESLEVYPSRLELSSLRDSRSLLVTAVGANGLRKDVTHECHFTAQSPNITVDDEGFVVAKSKGDAELRVSAIEVAPA